MRQLTPSWPNERRTVDSWHYCAQKKIPAQVNTAQRIVLMQCQWTVTDWWTVALAIERRSWPDTASLETQASRNLTLLWPARKALLLWTAVVVNWYSWKLINVLIDYYWLTGIDDEAMLMTIIIVYCGLNTAGQWQRPDESPAQLLLWPSSCYWTKANPSERCGQTNNELLTVKTENWTWPAQYEEPAALYCGNDPNPILVVPCETWPIENNLLYCYCERLVLTHYLVLLVMTVGCYCMTIRPMTDRYWYYCVLLLLLLDLVCGQLLLLTHCVWLLLTTRPSPVLLLIVVLAGYYYCDDDCWHCCYFVVKLSPAIIIIIIIRSSIIIGPVQPSS